MARQRRGSRAQQKRQVFVHEADRRTLIRRVTLDLTGLPPTLEEADAFVNHKSADAYERFVDKMLAKESYGEHWARMWRLDYLRWQEIPAEAELARHQVIELVPDESATRLFWDRYDALWE